MTAEPVLQHRTRLSALVTPDQLRRGLFLLIGVVALLLAVQRAGFDTPPAVLVLGAIIGINYGLLAVGL